METAARPGAPGPRSTPRMRKQDEGRWTDEARAASRAGVRDYPRYTAGHRGGRAIRGRSRFATSTAARCTSCTSARRGSIEWRSATATRRRRPRRRDQSRRARTTLLDRRRHESWRRGKCAPAAAASDGRRLARACLAADRLVGSDHSPAPASMKRARLLEVWGGIAGCSRRSRMSLTRAAAAAERCRVRPRGGAAFRLRERADSPSATMRRCVVDLAKLTLTRDMLLDRHSSAPTSAARSAGGKAHHRPRAHRPFVTERSALATSARLVTPGEGGEPCLSSSCAGRC
jgi:hypothetical protein